MKRQLWGALLLLLITGLAVWTVETVLQEPEVPPDAPEVQILAPQPQEGPAVQVLAPQAESVAGETLSPNGLWEIRLQGVNEGITASGLYAPEQVQVVNTQSGAVCWEDVGYYEQMALWSPEGCYLALARMARTHSSVNIIHPTSGTAWEFVLPDGSPIPEYTFLPEDWGTWLDEDTLRLTVGRGGDDGEQHSYYCFVHVRDGGVVGSTMEVTRRPLTGVYDFNGDGEAETLELVTVWNPEIPDSAEWYELQVWQEGDFLWSEEAGVAHVGWNSLFALRMDGEDFFLRYNPYMSQGCAAYQFDLLTLDEQGRECVVHTQRVEFDVNFGSPVHQSFDATAIADFLWAAKTLTDDSHLLLSTEGGALMADCSGSDYEAPWPEAEMKNARSRSELEARLRQMKAHLTASRDGVASYQALSRTYDFNQNGVPEQIELLERRQDAASGRTYWELEVTEGEKLLWRDTAYPVHAGWNAVFACEIEGKDYLLRYHPTMYQGWCTYSYQIFSLDGEGEEVPLREDSVEFDLNWNRPDHSFDAEAVLTFVERLNGELEQARLLMSNDDALAGLNPDAPQETLGWLLEEGLCPGFEHDETVALAENLRRLEAAMEAANATVGSAEPG